MIRSVPTFVVVASSWRDVLCKSYPWSNQPTTVYIVWSLSQFDPAHRVVVLWCVRKHTTKFDQPFIRFETHQSRRFKSILLIIFVTRPPAPKNTNTSTKLHHNLLIVARDTPCGICKYLEFIPNWTLETKLNEIERFRCFFIYEFLFFYCYC